MNKLRPCPFCGGKGCVQRHEFVGYTDTFGVVCLDCCCETRQFYDTKKDAIEAWNRRADRPHGYWIKLGPAEYRCSECGKIQYADDSNELNFCCCCGSDNTRESRVSHEKGERDE